MKRLAFLLLMQCSVLLYADLDDFEQAVQSTEQENEENKTPREPKKTEEEEDHPLRDFLLEILKVIWVANNTTATYGAYPYSGTGYIHWGDVDHGNRDQWFRADAQCLWMQDLGYGAWVSFKSHVFRFFGPYFEDWILLDGDDHLNGLRLGMTLSLFQSDPFSLSLYGQWNLWTGILERNGGTFGAEIDSFFIKPMALHLKGGFQLFPSFTMTEGEAQIGVFIGRTELLAGYRSWELIGAGGSSAFRSSGIFSGARVYF